MANSEVAAAATVNGLAGFEKNISDSIQKRLAELKDSDGLKLPQNYNVGNALKFAWLKLREIKDKNQKPISEVCSMESVANALLDMCVQGLSPAKSQCYFIVRGNQCTLMRSYFGTVAVMKRLSGIEDVFAQVIYKDDVFEYEISGGNLVVTKHEQKLQNIDMTKIVGAYSVIVKNGQPRCEIMTWDQIQTAWKKTSSGGGVQREYPDQMAKRTVINRGAKMYVNTSDDEDILIETINKTTASEYEAEPEIVNTEPVTLPPVQAALPAPQTVMEIPREPVQEPAQVETPKTRASRKPGF